jgi:hypothetical protein
MQHASVVRVHYLLIPNGSRAYTWADLCKNFPTLSIDGSSGAILGGRHRFRITNTRPAPGVSSALRHYPGPAWLQPEHGSCSRRRLDMGNGFAMLPAVFQRPAGRWNTAGSIANPLPMSSLRRLHDPCSGCSQAGPG